MTTLSTIASESFVHRLLPMMAEITLPAMHAFGEPPPIAIVAAGVGALAASALLYAVGVWMRRLPARVSSQAQRARIESLRALAMQWLPWLLILSPTPVGGMLVMAAGFFALRPLVAALAVAGGELLWRLSPLL